MKTFFRIVIMCSIIIFVMVGMCSASSSRGYVPVSLYWTGSDIGSHTSQTCSPPAVSTYYFQENSHSGSFTYLSVYITHVKIGNLYPAAMVNNGYPVSYNVYDGSPLIEMYMGHGTGAASFSGQVNY